MSECNASYQMKRSLESKEETLRLTIHNCRLASIVQIVTEQYEPSELKGSRWVLREPEGEAPLGYAPGRRSTVRYSPIPISQRSTRRQLQWHH
jgi:hypothetical protein